MPVLTREIASSQSGKSVVYILTGRLGKVKREHRQMETGRWEDPLR
jgi:hypothetical protein